MSKKEIRITVELDEENVPVGIVWDADDKNDGKGASECSAMMLSLYEKEHKETLKMDLWTKEFQVNEMDHFTFQSLRGLVDAYYRATQNVELANEMQRFVSYFGEKTGLIKPEK